MEWFDWIMWGCIFIAGYGLKGAVEDAKKPRHRWACPHCPLRVAASDPEGMEYAKRHHLAETHPGIHS